VAPRTLATSGATFRRDPLAAPRACQSAGTPASSPGPGARPGGRPKHFGRVAFDSAYHERSVPDPRFLDTPADLKRRLEAEREGTPFLFFRDGEGKQRIVTLGPARNYVSIGRAAGCDVCLDWDDRVSRLHARLERSGFLWTIHDDGLSRNGTFLNGERVQGHRVLSDRDELRVGTTEIRFRDTTPRRSRTVTLAASRISPVVSPAERKVLVALCRPYKQRSGFARPASNREIAAELVLSVDAVKSHLRALFAKFALDDLPQNEKRMRLVEQAFRHGLVRENEL